MEMIAGFRFKKAEHRFIRSKPFWLELKNLAGHLSRSENLRHPLFEKREVRKKVLVVVTADKGLCGAYNANLLKAAAAWLRENERFDPSLALVGKVGFNYFRKRPVTILSAYPEKPQADVSFAEKIAKEWKNFFLSRQADSIEVLYNAFRMGTAGQAALVPFLGLSGLFDSSTNGQKSGAPVDFIYEPGFEQVLNPVFERYLESAVYLLLLESLASEHSARMIAMKQATENGEEVLDRLRLLRNKTRQAGITREILEIVSGASVLV